MEHTNTCQFQQYNCSECGIILPTNCENFILEPVLFYNLSDIQPGITSENLFKKFKLIFTVFKYRIIPDDYFSVDPTSVQSANHVNTSVSNTIPECSTSDSGIIEDDLHSTDSDKPVVPVLISKTHEFEILRQKINDLKTRLSSTFSKNIKNKCLTRTLPESKVSDCHISLSDENTCNKNVSLLEIILRSDNTVSPINYNNLESSTPNSCSKIYINSSFPLMDNAYESKYNIKNLSVILIRLPSYVIDYQSFKIYCKSQVYKTTMLRKQKLVSKKSLIFYQNILPSFVPLDDDTSLVTECETSEPVNWEVSSNHVEMSSDSDGENSFEGQFQESSNQISVISQENSPLICRSFEMPDNTEQYLNPQSLSDSSSESCTSLSNYKCSAFVKKPVKFQPLDVSCQSATELTELSHVPYDTNEIMQVDTDESDALIINDKSRKKFKSVDKNKIDNIPDSLNSKPFMLWKTAEQLKYLRDRIKYINAALEEIKECKKKEKLLEPRVLLCKLPDIMIEQFKRNQEC
ncbi:hypothetical protein NPIL_577981 [Nephila pilipes]|nr:hypothetical protein NPIL_577981 [Nephila pilipes]